MRKLEPLFELIAGILFIFLGIEIVAYFGKFHMPLKVIGLVGFAAVLYGGFLLLTNLIVYSIYFFYKFLYDKKKLNQPDADKPLSVSAKNIIRILALVTICFFLYEARTIENVLGGISLLQKGIWCGIIVAVLLLFVVFKKIKLLRQNFAIGYSVFILIPLACCMLGIATLSLLNRTGMKKEITYSKMVTKKADNMRYGTKWIFIYNKNNEERLEVSDGFYKSVAKNDTVILNCKKGNFGYDVVVKISKKN
ncbi:MAG TPA: hypothetical protein PK736_03545 [Bacteroidia bacterium]|nr:hypothetical protein [Bacteroidia bacterium]